MVSMLQEFFSVLGDILFPPTCHICGTLLRRGINTFDANICRACAAAFQATPLQSCRRCSDPLTPDDDIQNLCCSRCLRDPAPAYDRLTTCFLYKDGVRHLIHKLKYANRPYLSKTLVRLMQHKPKLDLNIADFDALVPIPLHPARQREREFNQAELIARQIAVWHERPVLPALRRHKNTRPQSALDEKNRWANMQDAFRVARPESVKDKNLLLIDDIVTTTATTRAASRCLKDAGASRVTVLAFAKG
jgi:competence protein ComFC